MILEMIREILGHEFWVTFYGVTLLHIGGWSKARTLANKNNVPFKSSKWWSDEIDEIIDHFGWALVLIIFDDEVLAIYNKLNDTDFTEPTLWIYFLMGIGIDYIKGFIENKQSKNEK